MGSFPHHNFTKIGNKQAKTKYKRKIPMDLGNTINSLLQLSALPATYTREVHWLAAGSSESMADCMLGFCMGDFCYLLVGANLKVLCWSSFAFQKIQVIRPLNCELWKYLSFSIPFAVTWFGLCSWCPSAEKCKSFRLIATASAHTSTHTPCRNHPTAGVAWVSLAFRYNYPFGKSWALISE